jgi:hypothetical protein
MRSRHDLMAELGTLDAQLKDAQAERENANGDLAGVLKRLRAAIASGLVSQGAGEYIRTGISTDAQRLTSYPAGELIARGVYPANLPNRVSRGAW